jgi:hypothetical protein
MMFVLLFDCSLVEANGGVNRLSPNLHDDVAAERQAKGREVTWAMSRENQKR